MCACGVARKRDVHHFGRCMPQIDGFTTVRVLE
jgi:hypothetical protein